MEGNETPWWGVAWWIWALGCLAVALVYVVIDTEGAAGGTGWVSWMLRWGHSLCWVLLAASFLVRLGPFSRLANLTAAAGGLVYLGFLVVKFTAKAT